MLRDELGFTLRYIPIRLDGLLDLSELDTLLNERTKLFSFIHISNVLGTINPVAELVAAARAVGAKVLLDGAQSVPHMPVDVQALDVDFLAFSGHKMCGPTGIGVLYGKRELLEANAAVDGRRRHDPRGQDVRQQVEHRALQVRGGHALHRRDDWPGRSSGLPERAWAWSGSPHTSARWSNTPMRA